MNARLTNSTESLHRGRGTRPAGEPYTAQPWMASVAPSWRRSLQDYRIDPESHEHPRILTSCELRSHRDPVEELARIAQPELGRLYAAVGKVGYAVLLTSTTGAVIDYRGNPADAEQFNFWGISLGAMWSEEAEGTNGIGTCIAEERPVTVHRIQHFRARHANLSCSAGPIFDPEAKLAAVLDVTSMNPDVSDRAHAMALTVATQAARAIEERLFRYHFRRAWTLLLLPQDGPGAEMLLAVDGDHRIIGAGRNARSLLSLSDERLAAGIDLWTLFKANPTLLRRRADLDFTGQLTQSTTDRSWHVVATAPLVAARNIADAAAHSLPRIGTLQAETGTSPPAAQRGGLSVATMRRVQDYIGAHLAQKLDLQTLAKIAGFSVYHFAREFRNSAGVAPHLYVLQMRVERARQLLTETDMPMTEIAESLGFSDPSRFANQFRRMVGTTPSAYRRARR